jgi:hypothetical protein
MHSLPKTWAILLCNGNRLELYSVPIVL